VSIPRPSLRARLAVTFAALAGLVTLGAVLLVAADQARATDQTVDKGLEGRLTDVAAAARAGANDVVAADPYAQLLSADGTILAASPRAAATPLLSPEEVAAATGHDLRLDRSVPGLRHARVVTAMVTSESGRVLVVAASTEAAVVSKRKAIQAVLVATPVAVVLLGIGAWVLVGAALRPVQRLADEAERLSLDRPGDRLPVPQGDHEVAALARRLNGLLARVDEAIAADRQFLDDASHELRTPLGVLRGEVELALLTLADLWGEPARAHHLDALETSLTIAREEAERLSHLADDLLVLARLDRGELRLRRRAVHLRRLAEEVTGRVKGRNRVGVEGDDVLVNADPARLEQALVNLVGNADRHALSRVLVSVAPTMDGGAVITVADDGRGFPEHLLDHAFERFRRAAGARGRAGGASTGLGLAIVAAIAQAHGGTVRADNGGPYGGAVVTLVLPP
jgi:two-component system, OmpR family, sensor kinase